MNLSETKPKFPKAKALEVAQSIVRQLKPFCQRIEIAGSLRRGKEQVGDIEILFVPWFGQRAVTLFENAPVSKAGEQIDALVAFGVFRKRETKVGSITWGPKNKLAIHCESGIPVDFFETTNDNWPVALVIRTGSKAMNLKLTTGAQKLNRTLHAYGDGVEDRMTGEKIKAHSEADVFSLCGVKYLEPEKR